VDGFTPENFGRMAMGLPSYIPATPNGILLLLKQYEIATKGKHCVVLGRSHIVGLPISILMGRKTYPGNCTVTLAHSATENLSEVLRSADILIAAIGIPQYIHADMIKPGAVVIDVGINRVEDATSPRGFRLTGDVNFPAVAPFASYITPVPGGVGLMTVTSLLLNTFLAAQKAIYS
ncbi:MAG: bifunctional 5,10-methylene-tetrahydrofolate dehydrogenase/5,10-methylene-tetrahydrofolate cyclohydrolase, partial [Saprospiraceae bacterium]